MRKVLLTSSALAALLIATSFVAAQAPDQKRDEPKAEKSEKAKQAQERRGPHGEHRSAQPEPKGAASHQPAAKPTTAASERAKSEHKNEQKAEQKNEHKADQRKAAEDNRKEADEKRPSEKKNEPARSNAKRSQPDKSKSTAAPAKNEQKGADTQDQQKGQPKGATNEQQEQNKPAAAQAPGPTPSTNTATGTQHQPTSSAATTTQPNAVTANANHAPPEKKVQISESLSRTKLAPPVRNLHVSITIGTVAPPRVRFRRLPREVWLIEPRYRNYDYFSTDEDIVIVEPRTHRVVDMIPRDPSRARAQDTGSTTTTGGGSLAQAGNAPNCEIMRRDPASGQLRELRPQQLHSTTGSGSTSNQLAVSVQTSAGQTTPPVPLDAPAGQIVVATQGNGDCRIVIEPQLRR